MRDEDRLIKCLKILSIQESCRVLVAQNFSRKSQEQSNQDFLFQPQGKFDVSANSHAFVKPTIVKLSFRVCSQFDST